MPVTVRKIDINCEARLNLLYVLVLIFGVGGISRQFADFEDYNTTSKFELQGKLKRTHSTLSTSPSRWTYNLTARKIAGFWYFDFPVEHVQLATDGIDARMHILFKRAFRTIAIAHFGLILPQRSALQLGGGTLSQNHKLQNYQINGPPAWTLSSANNINAIGRTVVVVCQIRFPKK